MYVILRLELIWVNRDYTGLDWFLHLLKSAEACPLVNISVHLLSSSPSSSSSPYHQHHHDGHNAHPQLYVTQGPSPEDAETLTLALALQV